MRLSLKKGAHAVVSRAEYRKFRVSRSFFARCGIPRTSTVMSIGFGKSCEEKTSLTLFPAAPLAIQIQKDQSRRSVIRLNRLFQLALSRLCSKLFNNRLDSLPITLGDNPRPRPSNTHSLHGRLRIT